MDRSRRSWLGAQGSGLGARGSGRVRCRLDGYSKRPIAGTQRRERQRGLGGRGARCRLDAIRSARLQVTSGASVGERWQAVGVGPHGKLSKDSR